MNEELKNNLAGAAVLLAMVVTYTSENLILKVASGSILVIGLIISLIIIQLNSEISNLIKRISWIVLIPTLSLMGYLFSLLK